MTSSSFSFSDDDNRWMQRAIELAKKGCYTTTPNPNVGCVIVKDDVCVGEGWHLAAGGPHAEIHALRMAGEQARGATAYVTLEPCSHYGRTPPCAEALKKAGVARVVAAMVDPNPTVSGNGFSILEQAGIQSEWGLLQQDAEALNPGFTTRMREKRPFVRCKMAASMDGRTALANGESKWITGAEARADVQHWRALSCALISSAETVITDNASLTVRASQFPNPSDMNDYETLPEQIRQPVRIIIDNQCRLTPDLALFSHESPIVLVRAESSTGYDVEFPAFVEQWVVKSAENHVCLVDLLARIHQQNWHTLLLEAGAKLAGAFYAQSLIDEIVLYQAPCFMGHQSRGLFELPDYQTMAEVSRCETTSVCQVGADVRLIVKPVSEKS